MNESDYIFESDFEEELYNDTGNMDTALNSEDAFNYYLSPESNSEEELYNDTGNMDSALNSEDAFNNYLSPESNFEEELYNDTHNMNYVSNSEEVFNKVYKSKFNKISKKVSKNNKSKLESKHKNKTGSKNSSKGSSSKRKDSFYSISNKENNNSNKKNNNSNNKYKTLMDSVEDSEIDSETKYSGIENQKPSMDNRSYEEKETQINNNNNTNTVFILISCPHTISLEKDYINLTKKKHVYETKKVNIISSELRIINEKNYNLYNDINEKDKIKNKAFNSFGNKNIYLYCANLKLTKGKQSFKIEINCDGKIFVFDNKYCITKEQPIFIYVDLFDKESLLKKFFSSSLNESKLTIIQKFLIFEFYLIDRKLNNILPYLFKNVTKDIEKSKEIDIEFILYVLNSIENNFDRDLVNKEQPINNILPYLFKNVTKYREKSEDLVNKEKLIKYICVKSLKNKKYIFLGEYESDKYRKLINTLTSINTYNYDFDDNENLYYNLFLIILFYKSNSQNMFEEYYNQIRDKSLASKFILKHKSIFGSLTYPNLKLIYNNLNSINDVDINSVLSFLNNSNEYLEFFYENRNSIINCKEEIDFSSIPQFNKKTNFDLILKFIEVFSQLNKIRNPESVEINFNNLVSTYDVSNYNSLINLKEHFSLLCNQKTKFININILNRINFSIHYISKELIEKDKFTNIGIIKFIQEDAKCYYDCYRRNNEFVKLIGHIKINKIDKEFIEAFNTSNGYPYDYKKLFEYKYSLFITSIVNCANHFKDLDILFELFKLKENPYNKKEIIKEIIDLLANKSLDKSNISIEQISYIISYLLIFISNNDNYYVNDLIKNLKKIFTNIEVNELLLIVLIDNDKRLNRELISILKSNITEFKVEVLPSYLDQFKSEKARDFILRMLDNKVIKEKDFFNQEVNENLKLFKELIDINFFGNDYYKKSNYYNKTKRVVREIREKMENLKFTIEQLNQLEYMDNNNDYNLENRLTILYFGNKSEISSLYGTLKNKIEICNDTIVKIDAILENLELYYPDYYKNEISNYNSLKEKIACTMINEFPDKNKIIDFDKLWEIAKKLNELKTSTVFVELYNINKDKLYNNSNNKDKVIMDETENQFNSLEQIFNKDTEDSVDLLLLEKIINKINDEQLEKEIDILIGIFKKDNSINKNIFKKLKYLKNRKETSKLLKNIESLLSDFILPDQNIKEDIKSIIKDFEKKLSLKNLEEIYQKIEKMNINLLQQDKYTNAKVILNEMYDEPELMKFIIKNKIDDIHQMNDIIDDKEDYTLTTADIEVLENCMEFVNKLKDSCKSFEGKRQSEKNFIDNFIKLIEDDEYKLIGCKFEDASKKYSEYKDLLESQINKNECNIVKIKNIYESSKISINIINQDLKCKIDYENNKKSLDFSELLKLRDVALLRKKDHKEEYLKICNSFIDLVDNLLLIMKLINKINSKGYYEKINYIFIVTNGKAIGYKVENQNENQNDDSLIKNQGKNMLDIIEYLNTIKENQSKLIKDIYSTYNIIRYIWGPQLSEIYEYMCNLKQTNDGKTTEKSNIILNIFKYLKIKNSDIDINKLDIDLKDLPLKQMFIEINNYLNELFKLNNMNLNHVISEATLIDDSKRGLYTHSCILEDIECEAINCSLNLTGRFPIAQTVLYCNEDTTEEELVSFIYRSVKCQYKALYMLIKPESLNIKKKELLCSLLNEYYSEEMNSCLLILYVRENKNNIISEIQKISNCRYSDFKIEKENEKNKVFPDVKVYSSDYCGLGKSTLIRNEFDKINEKNEYKYVYFQLGGNINKNEIINTLQKYTNKKLLLHLDLKETNQISFIREFLFSFLILKSYYKNENIFCYENEIKVKIEIPNSFIDFKASFPILNFFENVNISFNNIPPLIVPNDLKSNIQVVCAYLNVMKQHDINKTDIYIEGISETKLKNSIDAKILSQKECQDLLFDNFKKLKAENLNYYQINSYITIVAEQLKLLTKSIYLNYEKLKEVHKVRPNSNLYKIRGYFIDTLLRITIYIITSSYNNILKGQNVAYNEQNKNINYDEAKKKAEEALSERKIFSIKDQPSMIFINEDKQSITEIINCPKNSSEYELLKTLLNTESQSNDLEVIDYSNLTNTSFLEEARKVLNLLNPIDEYDTDAPREVNGERLKYLKDITKSYVFTEDNFIKLIMISLRLRTNIPLIMMGETGCGKTSLIKVIADLKGVEMHTLNIHAGIEDKNIIDFIEKNELLENNSIIEQSKENIQEKNEKKDKEVWVFLDEINTCNSLGLITELMLDNTCRGKKIKKNVKFVAACNPYRLDTGKRAEIGLHYDDKYKNKKLVYSVNPLPLSLLNFVFDFGNPTNADIKKYIENIVLKTLEESINEKKIRDYIKPFAINSISNAHEFIINSFDISTASLREIRRWDILFRWFIKLINNDYFLERLKPSQNNIYLYSLNLSLYLCYYIRISEKEKRKLFIEEMKKVFDRNYDFEEVPTKIQNLIADEVNLEPGIAKNRPLLENLFSIFVCLNTKIPLFIIGKPGCSKSLSWQLISKSMKGKNSTNELFKEFPKVYTKSYQGSLTSNSEGILRVFENAEKSILDNSLNNIISAIYFDELGLAELSSNNPLKVIHSKLEYDDNKNKISFIGISNYCLDASKMNRGIHLSNPEPDIEDLKTTALAITKSYNNKLNTLYKKYFEDLSSAYYTYKKQLNLYPSKFENLKLKYSIKEYHGTRDFYYLIKIASKLLIKHKFPQNRKIIINLLYESIERNFGGLNNSVFIFKQLFNEKIKGISEKKQYDVIRCITENVNDFNSRYLLLITKDSISQFLITSILKELGKKYTFYYGSAFEDDTIHSHYTAKELNKIQVTMSTDDVMILKKLETVYPSLYDLFNRNFRITGNSKYSRIALENSSTQNYFTNDKFRCIVLIDKNDIYKEDPSFLNRFEKHCITFEYLLDKSYNDLSEQINKILTSIYKLGESKKINIDIKMELINCDVEEIKGLLYFETGYNKNPKGLKVNQYKSKIMKRIVRTFSQDIMFFIRNSDFAEKYNSDYKIISKLYYKDLYKHQSLKAYLGNIESNRHIIYTFSNILDSIFDYSDENQEIANEKYGAFNRNSIKNVYIDQYNSESEIDEVISEYLVSQSQNLIIFHYSPEDCIHLNHINYLIQNNENNIMKKQKIKSKVFMFIIHLKRTFKSIKNKNGHETMYNEYLISHLSPWKQMFIDNLNGLHNNFKEIYESSTLDLFKNNSLIDIEEEFNKDLYHAFTYILFNFKINMSSTSNNKYIKYLCKSIINENNNLKIQIQNSIMKKIENIGTNIIMKIFNEYNFDESEVDFISIIIKYMKSIYNDALICTIIQFAKLNILSSKILYENKAFNAIYRYYIDNFDTTIIKYNNMSSREKIDTYLGISFPGVIVSFKEIDRCIIENRVNYLDNENEVRKNLNIDIDEYNDKKNIYENNIVIKFKEQFINKYINIKDSFDIENHINVIFDDYIIYYLSKSNYNYTNKNIISFFDNLFYLFTNKKEKTLNNLAKFSLYIESYKEYIYILTEFIYYMDNYINGFLNTFNELIKSEVFEIVDKKMYNDKNLKYVNNIFFNLFESVVCCILSIKNYRELSDEIFDAMMKEIKVFQLNLIRINNELFLMLKQIFYLNDLVLVYGHLIKNGMKLKENLIIYHDMLISEDNKYLLGKAISNDNIINEEFDFLSKSFSKTKDYSDLIVQLILNKIKISDNKQYREQILSILCSKNSFIINSKVILESILKSYKLYPVDGANDHQWNDDENDDNIYNMNENDSNDNYEFDNDDEDMLMPFLLRLHEDNCIINKLNSVDSICLDEILLSIFDKNFSTYFNNKKTSKNDLILNQSFLLFKKSVEYIEENECEITKHNKLGILYCISYIKYYCYYLSKIVWEEKQDQIDKELIFEFIDRQSEYKFRKIIKIYILKILNLIFIRNYQEFKEFIRVKKIFINDFNFDEQVQASLDYLFIQNDSYNDYKLLKDIYNISSVNNFRYSNRIIKFINENKEKRVLNFYDLLINDEISNIKTKFDRDHFIKVSRYALEVLNGLNLSSLSKNILRIYYDYNTFSSQINSIQEVPIETFEMLLYSHKFAFMCSQSKPNSVYSNILSPNVMNNLKNIYIPGGEPNDNLLITSGQAVSEYHQTHNDVSYGVYMCSCYYWYIIEPCGFPMEKYKCKVCGQDIGGTDHQLVARNGHVRVYLNEQQRLNNRYKFNVPYIYLSELLSKVEGEKQIQIKGFKKVEESFFINSKKEVRNISHVTYRILSFIFYSCIYYNEKLGYLKQGEMKNFYFSDAENENSSIIYILNKIWKLLSDELLIKGIENVRCFLNLVINDISKIIRDNTKGLLSPEERNEFEVLCNNVIENAITNYGSLSKIYIDNNNEILKVKNDTMKSILQETSELNSLPKEQYPFINYFYVANYPSSEIFDNQFMSIANRKDLYPVITNYMNSLSENDITQFLQNFELVNPLVTYCLNKYNNKISRKEAKETRIVDELNKDPHMKKLFLMFKKGWKNVYRNLSRYDCHGELPEKMINEKDCLAYILIDNNEDGYGKYIATLYKDFITYHNEFLKPLVINDPNIEYLYSYSGQLKKEIVIEKANPNEIVSLNINSDMFNSFESLISTYSKRNFFVDDNIISYINYKDIKFDLDSIEKKLAEILLFRKHLLKNEQEMEFITYSFEGFNQNESIISDFREKIKKSEALSSEEKAAIINLVKEMDYTVILFNLQSLLLYFNNKRNIAGDELLLDEIRKLPKKIIQLDKEFINIFQNHKLSNIKLKKIIDFYEFIEYINYPKIVKNVPRNTELSQEEIKELDQHINAYALLESEQLESLNEHFKKDNLLISKLDLQQAIRKFISRFLVSERYKNFNWNIFQTIQYKSELWKFEIISDENEDKFNEEIDCLSTTNIKIEQSIDLYEKLGVEKIEQTIDEYHDKTNNTENTRTNSRKTRKKILRGELNYI